MAENKKSFLVYCDLIHTLEKMPDDKAGALFKHILRYTNDLNPITDDLVIELTFEPIKQQLKRDLIKWEGKSTSRSETGRLGGIKSGEARRRKMNQNEAIEAIALNTKQNEQVIVTDTVIDTVNVIDKDKDKIKKKSKKEFLPPTQQDCILYFEENGYNKDAAIKFFTYYSVADWYDSKGAKVSSWKQKAFSVWFKDENKIPQRQNPISVQANKDKQFEQYFPK